MCICACTEHTPTTIRDARWIRTDQADTQINLIIIRWDYFFLYICLFAFFFFLLIFSVCGIFFRNALVVFEDESAAESVKFLFFFFCFPVSRWMSIAGMIRYDCVDVDLIGSIVLQRLTRWKRCSDFGCGVNFWIWTQILDCVCGSQFNVRPYSDFNRFGDK